MSRLKRIPIVCLLVLTLVSPQAGYARNMFADPDITGSWQGTFNFATVGSCQGYSGTWKATITTGSVEWFDSRSNSTILLARDRFKFVGGSLTWWVPAKTGYVTYPMTFTTTKVSNAEMSGNVRGPLCDTSSPSPQGAFRGTNSRPASGPPNPPPAQPQPAQKQQPQSAQPQPAPIQPAPKPQPQPPAPAKPQSETVPQTQEVKPQTAVDKELERLASELIAAPEAIRKAKERLARYDEAVRLNDPARLRAALEDDLKVAAGEHRELHNDLLLGLPGVIGELGAIAKELAEAEKLARVAQAMTASDGTKRAINAVDALYKAPVTAYEGWEKLKEKKGDQAEATDMLPFIDGLTTAAVALTTAPGHWGEKLFNRVLGSTIVLTVSDLAIKTSLLATSQYRYWNTYNNLKDLEVTQELNRQRFETDIRKAEMKEKQLRAQVNRLRALDDR